VCLAHLLCFLGRTRRMLNLAIGNGRFTDTVLEHLLGIIIRSSHLILCNIYSLRVSSRVSPVTVRIIWSYLFSKLSVLPWSFHS
jgi:hypothetical protein